MNTTDTIIFTSDDRNWLIVFVTCGTISTIANLGVIVLILFHQRFQKSAHILLVNLALTDLTFAVSIVITSSADLYLGEWNSARCNFSGVMSALAGSQSLLSILLIALDRCYVIVALKRVHIRTTVRNIILTWIYSIIISLAPFLGVDYILVQPSRVYCISNWYDAGPEGRYRGYTLWCAGTLWGSVIVVIISYLCIHHQLRLTAHRVSPMLGNQEHYTREKRITRRMFIIVAVFFLVWSLYGISFMYQLITKRPSPYGLDLAAYLFILMGGIINPCLYVILDRNYQKALREIGNTCGICHHPGASYTEEPE